MASMPTMLSTDNLELLPTRSSLEEFNTAIQKAALRTVQDAAKLPADVNFHRYMDEDLGASLERVGGKIRLLVNRLAAFSEPPNPKDKGKAKLRCKDDVTDDFQAAVVAYMDSMFEAADMSLDDHLGHAKKPQVVGVNAAGPSQLAPNKRPKQTAKIIQHAHYIPKPQLNFLTPPDNSDDKWTPRLRVKPNAQVQLHEQFSTLEDSSSSLVQHPYDYEIRHIVYPSEMFRAHSPIPFRAWADTEYHWVDTKETLLQMVDELKSSKEIAVDLEHHSYRTYRGFLCLMQISTRKTDWIVDLLRLRGEMVVLNDVFTDSRIIKVMHGAESDVIWLQQDFDLYIVNLFDTYHASKVLDLPRHGLAHLLEMYCDLIPDKRYQLADWRIRPLPDDMLSYARSDTHYLLYIYDNLRNALLDRGQSRSRSSSPAASKSLGESVNRDPLQFVKEVLSRSEETTLRRYEKEVYDGDEGKGSMGWDSLARKWNKPHLTATAVLNSEARRVREVYKAIHAWRDRVARKQDENPRYILPNHCIFQLVEEKPDNLGSILKILQSSPSNVKSAAQDLLNVIKGSLEAFDTGEADMPASHALPLVGQAPIHGHSNAIKPTSVFLKAELDQPATAKISTKVSVLFKGLAAERGPQATEGLRERLTLIHRSLPKIPTSTLIPRIPLVEAVDEPEVDVLMEQEPEPVTGMTVEMPFVPIGHRSRKPSHDAIVIVGQKKRKRLRGDHRDKDNLPRKDTNDEASAREPDLELAPFDYNATSNILDEYAASEREATVKKRRVKDQSYHGDFPAPPRTLSEFKGGNLSHTFR